MKKLISYLLPVTCYLLLAVAPASAQGDDAVLDPETGQVMYYLSEEEMVGVDDALDGEEMIEEVDLEALEEEEGFLPSPTSPFYFLQQLRERWEDITANTPEEKAEAALKQARRRLLEMRKLSLEEGDEAESQFGKLQEKYEEKMQKAEEKAEQAGEKMEEVKEKILEKRSEQQQVLQGVLQKAPKQAQSALQKVIQRHEQNTERFINRWEERESRAGERLEKVQERIENRFEQQQGVLEKRGEMLEGAKERVKQRLEQPIESTETEAVPVPNAEIFKQRVGRPQKPQNVAPLKPSIAQPRPSPSVEKGKKVLGVFDKKTFWQGIWEMVKEMIL